MATYDDIKLATLRLIDAWSEDKDIEGNYLLPPDKPKYDAKTDLGSIGVGKLRRRKMTKAVNGRMRSLVGAGWNNVGHLQLADVETIGAFVLLMTRSAQATLPDGEPR